MGRLVAWSVLLPKPDDLPPGSEAGRRTAGCFCSCPMVGLVGLGWVGLGFVCFGVVRSGWVELSSLGWVEFCLVGFPAWLAFESAGWLSL